MPRRKKDFTESLSKNIITTFAMPTSSEDDISDHEKDLLGSSEKRTAKVPETVKSTQASQPKGVGGVEAVEDLIRQIEEYNFAPELAEFLKQKLQFLTSIFIKKSRDIRLAVREDILNNVITPIIEKFRNRETIHLTTIYDLQARPVGIEERTYQAKIRSCEEAIDKLKAQLQVANADLATLNKDLSATAKGLLESTKEVKDIIKKSKPSFSDVLQMRPPPSATQVPYVNKRSEHVVLLRPKSQGTSSEENRKAVETALVCRNSAARVNRISKVSNGGIIIEAPTAADFDALKTEFGCIPNIENRFSVTEPKRRRPQVIILGLDNSVDKDRLVTGLAAKNHFLCDTRNKPLFEVNFPIKGRRTTNWVISIDPVCYKRLFTEQGVYFEFSRYRYDNFFSIKQCKHCRLFGHTTKWCPRAKEVLCPNCGMDHSASDCKRISCVNCVSSNQRYRTNLDIFHDPFDRKVCECFMKQKENLVRMTDYGPTPTPSN
ncbi:hypothetical protein AVEN_165439-1 [Araneus ventricosus]|uniref:CCHC-type domain-containing protein n=1 Tax=Araneus ventricosus TaxID=182803 RepID=A0A4Y2AVY7_ARAVE|nr:hypothetical protein AVEN_165439-1 [Araneus ventricosus]